MLNNEFKIMFSWLSSPASIPLIIAAALVLLTFGLRLGVLVLLAYFASFAIAVAPIYFILWIKQRRTIHAREENARGSSGVPQKTTKTLPTHSRQEIERNRIEKLKVRVKQIQKKR